MASRLFRHRGSKRRVRQIRWTRYERVTIVFLLLFSSVVITWLVVAFELHDLDH